MSGKVSNFGGKKAAPFKRGKKRRAKVLLAKKALKKGKAKSADLANLDAAQRKALPASAFVFPKTREFPIPDLLHAKVALRLAGRVDPSKAAVVRAAVYKRYPNLKPKGD